MRKLLSISLFFLLSTFYAQVAERPLPAKLYNNLSNEFPDFLNSSEAARLEEKLEVFSNETSNQICVVVVDDMNGLEASDYATRLGTEWGVGKKDKNNGVVILIKPTGGAGGRDLFIAVGYGLEGAIPDLATKRIIEEQMYPFLKEGNNFSALDNATDVLMKLAKGEINVKDYTRVHRRERTGGGLKTALIIIVLIIFLLIRIFRGGGGGGYTYSRGGRNIFWGGGGFGGGSWGGGGSSSGGGWGGFGGGSFGGGGSGGKW